MTDRERSALLRMAGNVASGIMAASGGIYGSPLGKFSDDVAMMAMTRENVANVSVTIALEIFNDPRLKLEVARIPEGKRR